MIIEVYVVWIESDETRNSSEEKIASQHGGSEYVGVLDFEFSKYSTADCQNRSCYMEHVVPNVAKEQDVKQDCNNDSSNSSNDVLAEPIESLDQEIADHDSCTC